MKLIMGVELFDDLDEFELIEFGIPRTIHVRSDYFNNLPDYKFFKKFRLTKESTMFLLPLLENQLEFPTEMNQSVSPLNQLLTTLRYFATGSYLDSVGDYMGIDATTAGRIIHKVSRAVACLYGRFVKFPANVEEKNKLKTDFYKVARFPNVIGALDCTHIKILSPGGEDAEIYRNRKDYFSINVQAICDANNNFLDVVSRWPGSVHDSTIFNNSNIKARFETEEMRNCVLLGDKGYALKSYLLTPLLNPVTQAEQLYNESHIRTRNKIECTFGIIKRRFPVLAYGCRLKVQNILPVIIATTVLYNIARLNNECEPGIDGQEMNENELEDLIDQGQVPLVPQPEERVINQNTYRNQLIHTYFSQL